MSRYLNFTGINYEQAEIYFCIPPFAFIILQVARQAGAYRGVWKRIQTGD